jgi:hypothetical protein
LLITVVRESFNSVPGHHIFFRFPTSFPEIVDVGFAIRESTPRQRQFCDGIMGKRDANQRSLR